MSEYKNEVSEAPLSLQIPYTMQRQQRVTVHTHFITGTNHTKCIYRPHKKVLVGLLFAAGDKNPLILLHFRFVYNRKQAKKLLNLLKELTQRPSGKI